MIMGRVPGPYMLTSLAVGTVLVIHVATKFAGLVLVGLIPIPFLPSLVLEVVTLILPTVACRMLGIFLHHHRHELGLGLT
jgi:uncharacterized protein (DUF697 family)